MITIHIIYYNRKVTVSFNNKVITKFQRNLFERDGKFLFWKFASRSHLLKI